MNADDESEEGSLGEIVKKAFQGILSIHLSHSGIGIGIGIFHIFQHRNR